MLTGLYTVTTVEAKFDNNVIYQIPTFIARSCQVLINHHEKIEAIRLLRSAVPGMELKEAKDIVESLCTLADQLNITNEDRCEANRRDA